MRGTAAHVFVDDLALPSLAGEDFHHLSRVLRLRPGETVSASDGRGHWRLCSWEGSPSLSPLGEVAAEAPGDPLVTVGFALTKGEKPEWAVQKLTEVGVDRIVLITSARCVVRWDDERAAGRLARLRAVAREAAMQSRRVWLPTVEGPMALEDLVTGGAGDDVVPGGARDDVVPGGARDDLVPPGARDGLVPAGGRRRLRGSGPGRAPGAGCRPPDPGVALAEPGGGALTLATPTVVVGPEGGWSEAELAAAPVTVGLGPHVLRAETAAVAAGVMLVALRAGLVGPARR